MDILDTTVTDGAFWARCLLAHNKLQYDELIRCTSNGIGKIGNRFILPCLLTGQSWGQPLACKVIPIGDDEEEEAKPAINALTTSLAEITDLAACSVAPPARVATSPGDFDGLDFDGIAATSPSIPQKLGTASPKTPKDIPLNEKLCVCATIANLGWDRTAESLHLPVLPKNGKWIYRSTDRARINEAMVNIFANIPKAIAHSTDILHREVDLPHKDPLVYALYATSHYEVSTMQSIELTGESKKRSRYFYLVPDSKSLAKESETASYIHEAKELLGKAKENLSKVKTTITMSTAITSMHHLRTYLTYICVVIKAQFIWDLSLKDIRTPAMFVVAHTFALHLSSASMRSYLKKTSQPHKLLVLWAVQMLDQLSILLTHPLRYAKNTFLVTNNRLPEVTSDKFIEAFELLDDCMSTLRKFESGTGTIPSCPLLQADEAKAAKAKMNKTPKHPAGLDPHGSGLITTDPKCQRGLKPSNATPSGDDLNGTLVYTGTDMMPTVNETNLSLCLCAARQRVGHHCPRSASCMMIHDMDITKWLDATFAKWAALVDRTPALEWNWKVVNPAKVAARSSKLSASYLTNASASKAKA
jgi:hypothetical protein